MRHGATGHDGIVRSDGVILNDETLLGGFGGSGSVPKYHQSDMGKRVTKRIKKNAKINK
jgi:hypothetical protein